MDKFFSNLGGGGDKKNKSGNKNNGQRGKDGASSDWQGGRSGDMDSMKKKNASTVASRIGGGGGGGGSGNKASGNGNAKGNNIFANAGAGINDALGKMDMFNKSNKTANSRGGGQSLGGMKPGKVFSVSLDKPGPFGIEVEKRKTSQATAIVSAIVPNGQADMAGLKRGDIVCHPRTNGEEEYRYDQFLAMAKSGRRPLRFDVRRIESSIVSGGDGRTGSKSRASADSYARKQAVIAAAEAREAKHKAKQKPIPKTDKRMDGLQPKQQIYDHHQTEESEETRRAVAAVKQAEKDDAKNLGYNPYESKAMTSGQARTATVAMACGDITAENTPSKITGSGEGGMSSPGRVNKPKDPTPKSQTPPTPQFEQAFSTLVTSNADNVAVLKSLGIMRKLINNAITKGQQGNDETSSKFRRVRLSNPKIKETVADIQGGLELMMSAGFVLSENDEDGETYLVFPPGEKGSSWLDSALEMMESYENGGS
ncbi:hypothetical protein ACHAXR_010962 [Thalassiosira sp. AJA248-18]